MENTAAKMRDLVMENSKETYEEVNVAEFDLDVILKEIEQFSRLGHRTCVTYVKNPNYVYLLENLDLKLSREPHNFFTNLKSDPDVMRYTLYISW